MFPFIINFSKISYGYINILSMFFLKNINVTGKIRCKDLFY